MNIDYATSDPDTRRSRRDVYLVYEYLNKNLMTVIPVHYNLGYNEIRICRTLIMISVNIFPESKV